MNNFKKAVVVFIVPAIVGVLYIADHYFYSWTGELAALAGKCNCKQITVLQAKSDGFKKLNYPVNLARATANMRNNQNYVVLDGENGLIISRQFGDLKYSIAFEARTTPEASVIFYKYMINCADCSASSLAGEKCTAPDFEIYKKIYLMIHDLALDHRAAYELQSGLKIYHQSSPDFPLKGF